MKRSLGKLLKAGFLEKLLGQALATCNEAGYVAVLGPDGLVAAHGDAPAEILSGLAPALAHVSLPLTGEGREIGRLLAGPQGNPDPMPPALGHMARFLANALEECIRLETVRRAVGEEALKQYREASLTHRAVHNLNLLLRPSDVARGLLDECRERFRPGDSFGVYLRSADTDRHACIESFGPMDRRQLDKLAHSGLFQDVVRRGKGETVNELRSDSRWQGEVPELSSLILLPLAASGDMLGVLALARTEQGQHFRSSDLMRAETLATVAGIAMSNAMHMDQVQQVITSLMQTMATAIDSRDQCTAGHSQRVALLAVSLLKITGCDAAPAPGLSLAQDSLQEMYYAGLLHDVGKIGVREEVLAKDTRLPLKHLELIGLRLALWGQITDKPWEEIYQRLGRINRAYDILPDDEEFIRSLARERIEMSGRTMPVLAPDEQDRLFTPRGNLSATEWDEIRRHPAESHRILQNIPLSAFFPNLLTIILQHHERLDGSGYPSGRKGAEILLQSRILAIVDVYDSLRRDRHYKKALSQDTALKVLREEARLGKLDSGLVDVFCRHVDEIERDLHLAQALPGLGDIFS